MRYYEVVAKCGHVGRNYYYEGHFFLTSSSASSAAQYVKTFPRVKKDHEDAILWVNEINQDEYIAGCKAMKMNPYFACGSKHEQDAIWDLIQDGIRPETKRQILYREKCTRYDGNKQKEKRNNKGIRNPYKYAKYNYNYEYDYLEA